MIVARGIEVTRRDAGGSERPVLEDVGLQVERGEILGLIGPPDSGKTTVLKALAGLVTLRGGEVRVDGARVDQLRAGERVGWQQRIGMAFQNDALFDAMTVFENVAFPLRRRRVPPGDIDSRALQRLRDVELAQAAQKLPSEISGGMRKRVGIARATVTDPELGLFDDPIAGLDPVTGALILELIVHLTASLRMACIVISNDLAVLLPICRRVMMLNRGRVVYVGAPDGLSTSPRPEVVQFATGSDDGPL